MEYVDADCFRNYLSKRMVFHCSEYELIFCPKKKPTENAGDSAKEILNSIKISDKSES